MAGNVNKVILIGRLGKDPEMKYTEKGSAYCRFSLATTETYKDANGKKVDKTEWHDIVAWRKLAELCHTYLKSGSKIYCEGKISSNMSEKDGIKRKFVSIIINDMKMLDSKKEQPSGQPGTEKPETEEPSEAEITESSPAEDLPF